MLYVIDQNRIQSVKLHQCFDVIKMISLYSMPNNFNIAMNISLYTQALTAFLCLFEGNPQKMYRKSNKRMTHIQVVEVKMLNKDYMGPD